MSTSPTTRAWYPLCFDNRQQYSRWHSMYVKVKEHTQLTYCSDCTRAYQQRMIAQGRCARPTLLLEEEAA